MPKREKIAEKNNYFTSAKDHIQFVSTGCTLVDCALGGGFALGRVANIVGDKSTSKTGLATECLINFCRAYPDGQAAYRDIEAAFDTHYAEAMGLQLDKIDMGDGLLTTVEAWHRDLEKFVDKQIKSGKPGIYVLDSLDALSDEAELERDIGEGSYGGAKAKKSSEMFRRLTPKIEASKVLGLVVSQVRDNIGAMFGEKHKRSGGKALDFYASQIVWLSHINRLSKVINKVKRPYGIEVKAQVKKNKIAMPFRECNFEFHFGYGIEDLISNLNWLEEVNRLDGNAISIADIMKMDDAAYFAAKDKLAEITKQIWAEIEESSYQNGLNMGPLNQLSQECHAANQTWWHDPATGERLNRNKGELLMLIVSEVAEAMEGERKNLMDDKLINRKMAEVELADALIRIFDYAGAYGYDLDGALAEKRAYNATRADHKPKNRLAPGGKRW